MIDLRRASSQIRFSGASLVAPIADEQHGPTCGFEALENVIQLFYRVGDISETDLVARARNYKGLSKVEGGYAPKVSVYQRLLADYNIAAHWYPFDFLNVIIPALAANRVILALGEGYPLNPVAYVERNVGHAYIITNYYTDETGYYFGGCVGIDSNFANRESVWNYQSIQESVSWSIQQGLNTPLLITDNPVNWPIKARFYRMLRTGQLVPVP